MQAPVAVYLPKVKIALLPSTSSSVRRSPPANLALLILCNLCQSKFFQIWPGATPGVASPALPAKLAEATSNSCPPPPPEGRGARRSGAKGAPSLALSTHLQTQVPTYCFATVTALPQILVTQDLSNQPICQANRSMVPIWRGTNSVPKPQSLIPECFAKPRGELVHNLSFQRWAKTHLRPSPCPQHRRCLSGDFPHSKNLQLPVKGCSPQQIV